MSIKYVENGTVKDIKIKVGDNIPVGTIVEFDGQDIPVGWEDYGNGKIKKVSTTTPTQAQVVDGYSISTTDSYACNYINNALNEQIKIVSKTSTESITLGAFQSANKGVICDDIVGYKPLMTLQVVGYGNANVRGTIGIIGDDKRAASWIMNISNSQTTISGLTFLIMYIKTTD